MNSSADSAAGALRKLHKDQIEYARDLSLLLYTRDRNMHNLAKKLKAVFNHVYISGEIKDSQKIINKFSRDVIDSKQLIDIMVVDFDQSGLKMVDFVNRRAHNPEFRNCPVIPIIVLANETNKPNDIFDHAKGCGGVHKIISFPYTVQEVILGVLEATYRLHSVENTFRDLQRATVVKAKLPYLPVFDAKSAAKINVVDGEVQKVSVATSMSTLDNNKVEEIDDCGSQCDDVLPEYLRIYQRKPKEKADPYDFSQYGQSSELRRSAPTPLNPAIRSSNAAGKSVATHSRISKPFGLSGPSVTIQEPTIDSAKYEPSGLLQDTLDESQLLPGSATEGNFGNSVSFGMAPMENRSLASKSTNGVQVDSKSYAETLLGDDSTDFGRMEGNSSIAEEEEGDEENRNAIQRLVLARQEEMNGLPPLQRLLDKSIRPFWSGALSTTKGIDENIVTRARRRTDMEHDISTFVDRPRPKTANTLTVSGLNKRVMEGYWKQLRNSYSAGPKDLSDNTSEVSATERPRSASISSAGIRRSAMNTSASAPVVTIETPPTSSRRPLSATSTTGKVNSATKLRNKKDDLHRRALQQQQISSTEQKTNDVNDDIQYFSTDEDETTTARVARNTAHLFSATKTKSPGKFGKASLDISSIMQDTVGSSVPANNAVTNTNAMHELMTREYQASLRAERKIATLAKEVPADFHVSTMLDVNLNKRRINLGEKGMLEKGLALEKDGDFESASICYSRAGAHSKDPQISRMLLGNLHYRANHLMMALRCYNTAIEIVENKTSGLRVIDDEFLGYRNRAVINFRLGNDAQGLSDLQKAVKVNPTNLPARELLSLVKRRMGMYSEAMEDAHVVKIQRLEEDRLRREQLEKEKKQRAAKVRYNHDGKMIIHARQRAGGLVAGLAKQQSTEDMADNNNGAIPRFGSSQQQQQWEARQSREAALRGVTIAVPEPSCLSSLRERVAAHRSSSANDLMSGEDGGASAGGFLRLFKMTQGMKTELFDEIFVKPTELQLSLLREPHLRTPQDIQIISNSALGVFPFLRNLAPSILNELSAVIEYRAVSSGGADSVLFKQNQESPGVCFLLTGHVNVTMETSHVSALHGVEVVKLQERSAFGHFDLLFRNMRTSFLKSLEEVLVSVRSNITDRLRPAEHFHDDNNNLTGNNHNNNNNNNNAQIQSIHHNTVSNLEQSTSSGSHQMSAAMMMLLNTNGGSSNNPHHNMQTNTISASQQLHLLEQEKLQHDQLQKERNEFQQLFYHQVDHQTGKLTSRGVQPGMFMSYTMSGPCELLLLNERDFYRILYDPTVKALQQRIQTLRSSGIFKGWKHEDLIRLTRMCQVFTFKRGDTILQQASKPEYLYIIQKGLCKVMKRPNRTEMLMQKLQLAKEKAARIDFKYVYHHGVYNPNDPTWEPLRDLSTPIFAAPTGPTMEELAAAEIAAASAISTIPSDSANTTSNTNNANSSNPVNNSNNSVNANANSSNAGGTNPMTRMGSTMSLLPGNSTNNNSNRPRTSQSRTSFSSRADGDGHRSNGNSPTKPVSTSPAAQMHAHANNHHHVDAAAASAMMHPHDARSFSPNHVNYHPESPKNSTNTAAILTAISHDLMEETNSADSHSNVASPSNQKQQQHQSHSKSRATTAPGGLRKRRSSLLASSFSSTASSGGGRRIPSNHGQFHPKNSKGFRNLDELRAFPTSDVPPERQRTIHEEERQALAREIAKLEALIKVAREQDAIDQKNHETQDRVEAMRLKRTESFYSVASASSGKNNNNNSDLWSISGGSGDNNTPIEQVLASQLNRKQAEIKLLQWPMIFGESCVLQPEDGVSRGSIVADTTVECIVLHRMQLQTFAVDEHFLDRVRDKAVVYPGDPDIVVDLFRKQNWQQYKNEVMQDISKSRWPKRLDDLEAFVV